MDSINASIKDLAKKHGILNNNIYLYTLPNTNGIESYPKLEFELTRRNYTVIKRGLFESNKSDIGNEGFILTLVDGELAIIVGNINI